MLLLLIVLVLPVRASDEANHFLVPKRRALVVGASKYDDFGNLAYAASDARKIAALLEEQLGFEVTLLHDGDPLPGELDRHYRARLPSGDRIVATLRELVAKSTDADQFLFYYCGHGEGRADGDVLIPRDLVEGSEDLYAIPIRDLIVKELAPINNAVVMIDACRSGEFGSDIKDLEGSGVSVLLACSAGQVAHETNAAGGGIFTSAVIEAFMTAYDERMGGLWFSKIAGRVQALVPPMAPRGVEQVPQFVGGDDVLVDALLGDDAGVLLDRIRNAEVSGWDTQAILTVTAELWHQQEFEQAVNLLEFVDQDVRFHAEEQGERPLLMRLAELYRLRGDMVALSATLERVRKDAPGTRDGWLAAVVDDTGALNLFGRAHAARELWATDEELPFDTRLEMIGVLTQAGDIATAASIARNLADLVPAEDARAHAYVSATLAAREGRASEAFLQFHEGRKKAGHFPTDETFYLCEYRLLQLLGERDLALDCAGEAATRFPDEGYWRLHVAHAMRLVANTRSGLSLVQQLELYDQAHEHIAAALTLELAPDDVLTAVALDGARALELVRLVEPYVELYPDAWQPALALAFTGHEELNEQGEGVYKEAVRVAAEVLSPHPASVYLRIVRLTYEGAQEQILRAQAEIDPTAAPDPQLLDQFTHLGQFLYGRFYEYLDGLALEPEAWEVFQRLSQLVQDDEGFVRTFEAVHGRAIDRGDLPVPLVYPAALSYLATNRLERYRQLRACIPFPCEAAADLAWAEAVHLVALGEDDQVRQFLDSAPPPPSEQLRSAQHAVRILLAAREGDRASVDRHYAELEDMRSPYCFPLLVLALIELDAEEATAPYWQLFSWVAPGGAIGAYAAALAHHPVPSALGTFAALRPQSPYTQEFTFAEEPGRKGFKGSYAYEVHPLLAEGRFLEVEGWTLYLDQGRNGYMNGSLVDESAGDEAPRWLIAGRVDEYGNLSGTVDREDPQGRKLQIFAKLHPLAQLEADAEIVEAFAVYDEEGARVDLRGVFLPEQD